MQVPQNIMSGSTIAESHGSSLQGSLLQMQITELLHEQTPNFESRARSTKSLLADVRQIIQSLPSRDTLRFSDLQNAPNKHLATSIPFPAIHLSVDSQHRFRFRPPAQLQLIGSFPLETRVRHDGSSCIDLIAIMPIDLLEEKDFLDYRYIHKRAYYLACLAEGLEAKLHQSVNLSYSYRDDNELQPCIMIEPREPCAQSGHEWSCLKILVGAPSTIFPRAKLQPWLSCLRDQIGEDQQKSTKIQAPTPLYNGTIVSDSSLESYHHLLTEAARSAPNFKSACKLTRLWLLQRGFASRIRYGGFGCFESGCCLALLLESRQRTFKSLLSKESDTLQLFVSLLQLLAYRDLVQEPHSLDKPTEILRKMDQEIPVLYDSQRHHNVLFKMSLASYRSLKMAAQRTLDTLAHPDPFRFYPIFIGKAESVYTQYDYVFKVSLTSQPMMILQTLNDLYQTLRTALSDRIHLVDIRFKIESSVPKWGCSSTPPSIQTLHEIQIGITVNPAQVARRVDVGPSEKNLVAAKSFRDFWEEKAELRRFADGDIRESVTWLTPILDEDVLNEIVTYIVRRRFPHHIVNLSGCKDVTFSNLLPQHALTVQTLKTFETVEQAFRKLQERLWAISGQPLRFRQIYASHPSLRYATVKGSELLAHPRCRDGLDVVIQFEGSLRWPEDLVAVQHTKIALLSKIGELLESETVTSFTQVGLEHDAASLLNRAFLDVVLDGFMFRLRIYHDRESALLERIIKDQSQHVRVKELAVSALFTHKRTFLYNTKHTQAVRELCGQMPLVSPTIRLLKLWVSSHLLSSHFSEELFELIVIHIFTFPFPNTPPGSLRSGFLRSLAFIAKWDWQCDPLIVNFSSKAVGKADLDAMMKKFHEWRRIDPAMHRISLFVASSVEHDGTAWTSPRPSIVAINRLVTLADAVGNEVVQQGLDVNADPLFSRSLKDYDFVVHLHRRWSLRSSSTSRCLPAEHVTEESAIRKFVEELEHIFLGRVVFFHDREAQPVICGLWLPQSVNQEWKVSSSWGTMPSTGPSGESPITTLNKDEVLQQIAMLGGGLISHITR